MSLLKMCCFTLITCIVFIAVGAVGDNGIVKVKRGEDFSLFVRTSQPKMVSLRKVLKNNETQEIFCYCSPEEQYHGCKPSNSSRFSHFIGKKNFSVTLLDANNTSDEGDYIVEVIDYKNKRIQHYYSVLLTEPVTESEAAVPSQDPPKVAKDVSQKQLPSSINPEPPSIHPFTTPAISTKAKERVGINGPITTVSTKPNHKITGGIIGGLLGLIVAIVVTGVICCKKKKQNHIVDYDAEDRGKGTLNSETSEAGEPATDESLEILVKSDCSVDNKNKPVHGA